jgi:cell division protein FtsW (lipid II flippase)
MFAGPLLALVVVVVAALGVLLHAAATKPTTSTRDIPASRFNRRLRMFALLLSLVFVLKLLVRRRRNLALSP